MLAGGFLESELPDRRVGGGGGTRTENRGPKQWPSRGRAGSPPVATGSSSKCRIDLVTGPQQLFGLSLPRWIPDLAIAGIGVGLGDRPADVGQACGGLARRRRARYCVGSGGCFARMTGHDGSASASLESSWGFYNLAANSSAKLAFGSCPADRQASTERVPAFKPPCTAKAFAEMYGGIFKVTVSSVWWGALCGPLIGRPERGHADEGRSVGGGKPFALAYLGADFPRK